MVKQIIRRSLRIYGRVQGVYYRAGTREKAIELGLSGIVFNMPDGSVYVEAQGVEDMVDALEEWCHEGPRMAVIERIESVDMQVREEQGFEIRRF